MKRKFYLSLLAAAIVAPLPAAANDHLPPAEEEMLGFYFSQEQLVEAPTRVPKPITQVAENVTVVTAAEIERMNAHTVAEVLNRVPGVFMDFAGRDFLSTAQPRIQGSNSRHVTVLVDGIPWNFLSGGNPNTTTIPVQTIDRIEVIKGPASSAWGSALGGVVNIITKKTGSSGRPNGMVAASAGERGTSDSRAELAGGLGRGGYYLYAGHQESDGLYKDRDSESDSLFGKLSLAASERLDLTLETGYAEPRNDYGHLPSGFVFSEGIDRVFFANALADVRCSDTFSAHFSAYSYRHKFVQLNSEDGTFANFGPGYQQGDLFQNNIFDEETLGGSGRLVWEQGRHTAVAGVDLSRGALDQTIEAGAYRQFQGAAPVSSSHPRIERQALYLNDTVAFDRWSLTPGLRFDHNSVSGDFLSPSLGATWQLTEATLLRGTVARGFTAPPLAESSGGGLFLDPNPDLDPETVWSFEAGLETTALPHLWCKLNLFHHEIRDAIGYTASPLTAGNIMAVNSGKERRRGGELELATVPWHGVSLVTGGAYAHLEPYTDQKNRELYSAVAGLRYQNETLFAELFGYYLWWGLPDSATKGDYDNFIWDLNLSQVLYRGERTGVGLFATVHNLFSGAQYSTADYKDPARWLEAGIRLTF